MDRKATIEAVKQALSKSLSLSPADMRAVADALEQEAESLRIVASDLDPTLGEAGA